MLLPKLEARVPALTEECQGESVSVAMRAAGKASQEAWLSARIHLNRTTRQSICAGDLDLVLSQAEQYFGDVVWRSREGEQTWAHKAIVYARSTAPFQSAFLGAVHLGLDSASSSSLSLSMSSLRDTPRRPVADQIARSDMNGIHSTLPASASSTEAASTRAISLIVADHALLRPALEVMYTSRGMAEAFRFLFDQSHGTPAADQEPAVIKLREDLLFVWRAKLFSDVKITLASDEIDLMSPNNPIGEHTEAEDTEGMICFTAHRVILAGRSPYFRNILLSDFADVSSRLLKLPSSAFTSAALHFLLGSLYCGTIKFSQRSLDLATTCDIIRGALYLQLDHALAEAMACIEYMCHAWKGCCRTCARRCAHVLHFAQSADLGQVGFEMRENSLAVVAKTWPDAWNTANVGNLQPDLRRRLAERAADLVDAETAIFALSSIISLRSQLPIHGKTWTDRVSEMLDLIDSRVRTTIASDFTRIVDSPTFASLLDGQFFTLSRDVLTELLEIYIGALTEHSAPSTYQVLTGSVLLREAGLPLDARVLVENARQVVLQFIKRRWVSIRSSDSFAVLEKWALKEIADELDMRTDDLLNQAKIHQIVTRTGLTTAANHSNNADATSLRSSVLNRSAAKASRLETGGKPMPPQRPSAAYAASSVEISDATALKPMSSTADEIRVVRTRRTSLAPTVPRRTSSNRSRSASPVESSGHHTVEGAAPNHASAVAEPRISTQTDRTLPILTERNTPARQSNLRDSRARHVPSVSASGNRANAIVSAMTGSPQAAAAIASNFLATSVGRSKQETIRRSPRLSIPISQMASKSSSSLTLEPIAKHSRCSPWSETEEGKSPAKAKCTPKSVASLASIRSASSRHSAAWGNEMVTGASSRSGVRTSAEQKEAKPKAVMCPAAVKRARSIYQLAEGSEAAASPLPGTVLRVPLPALVSFANGTKAKAKVHFLGQTHLSLGKNVVGVCVDEVNTIRSDKAQEIWCDGSIGGRTYFSAPDQRCAFVQPDQVLFLL